MKTKKLLSLILLGLLCSIGTAWGDAVVPSATWTVGDVTQLTTWGWASKGQTNSVYQSGDTFAIPAYLAYQSVSNQSWIGYNVKGGSSNSTTAWAASNGFGGATYYFGTGDKDGKYYWATTNSKDPRDYQFYVTNCVAVYVYGNASKSGRNINLKAYVISSGTPSGVAEKSATYGTVGDGSFGITGLDKTKSYKISVQGDNESNCNFYEIAFVRPASTPAATYSVTINPNGGSYASTPDGWTYDEENDVYTKSGLSGSFNVPSGLTKAGYDLNGWKDGQGTDITTLPITLSKDTTLVAQWVAHATSSDATLSALSVAGCTLNETFDPATTAYTIDLPFYASMPAVSDVTATKNDSYAADPEISISGNVITIACEAEDRTTTKTYTITVTIADVPTASSSINIEQLILDNSKSYDIGTALTTAHIAYVDKDALDSLLMGTSDKNKTDCNEAYLGLKFKKATSKVTIIVPSNQSLKVKFGATNNLTVSVNGSVAAAPSLTNNVYELAASDGAKEVIFALTGTQTVVLKQIMINEAIATVRPFAINLAATTNGTISTSLPKYAKGEEVTIVCEPNSGYQLGSLSVSGYDKAGAVTSVTVTSSKFTMPGSPANITATFIPTTVSKTITSAGWATYCSPYALDFSSTITNLEAAYIVTGASGDVVSLTEVEGTVPAETGLLLKGNGDCVIPVVASSTTDVSANKLIGKTAEYTLPAGEGYVLLKENGVIGFYMNPDAAFTVGANTAYLPANFAETNAPSAFRLVDEENNATNIENVEANEKAVKFIENGRILILRDGITYDALGRVVR